MTRLLIPFLAILALSACGAQPVWAPDQAVEQAAYVHDGPSKITVYTVVNNASGRGAHSALLINGHQRVLFDPAGTFSVNVVPERDDVHYGMTERMRQFYELFHARESYHTVAQEIEVPREVADQAIALAQGYGAVSKFQCVVAVTDVLAQLPGFESVESTYFPDRLRESIAQIDGVTERSVFDWDSDDKQVVQAEFNAALGRSQ